MLSRLDATPSHADTGQLVGTTHSFEVEINGDGFNVVGTEDTEKRLRTPLVE